MVREQIVVLASWTLVACGAAAATPATPTTSGSIAAAPASNATPAAPAAPAPAGQPSTGLKAPGEATIGDRTTCPVSKEEFTVTAESPKVTHQGRTYYFCCAGCDAKFKKDPEKYLKGK